MKKHIREIGLALGFAVIGYGFGAMPALPQDRLPSKPKNCATLGVAAAQIMRFRDAGVSRNTLLNRVDDGTPEGDLLQSVVLSAFVLPPHEGFDIFEREQAAIEYGQFWANTCRAAFGARKL